MTLLRKHLLLIGSLMISTGAPPAATAAQNHLTHLVIHQQTFHVEVPTTQAGYFKGLSQRQHLPPNHGMLFYFDHTPKPHPSMWMKDTVISLDMLFIGTDNKIACLVEHTQPLSLHIIQCDKPIRAVLEINAGEARLYNMKVGDAVHKLGALSEVRETG